MYLTFSRTRSLRLTKVFSVSAFYKSILFSPQVDFRLLSNNLSRNTLIQKNQTYLFKKKENLQETSSVDMGNNDKYGKVH